MNPRELVDHIRSGPAELVLDEPLRFRRRTRSNPCDFNEFLQALQTSETIRIARCASQTLGITEDEWVLLVKTMGRIQDVQLLVFNLTHDSREFRPFQAVAEAVNSARSLRKLRIGLSSASLPRDPSGIGIIALANALREHTSLQEFIWNDSCSRVHMEAAQITALDRVLWALPACPHLRKVVIMTEFASADTMKNLLQLRPAAELSLVLEMDQWLAVADGIRQGHCNIKHLCLEMFQISRSETTEAVKAVASAIREDSSLECLVLPMEDGFTDEAGEALAEALTVNKTLRMLLLSDTLCDRDPVHTKGCLGAPAYDAFSAMLRVNTSLVLRLPPFETADADERLRESHKQMEIEQVLNKVGRGRLLASRQTPREEWVDALHELSSSNVDETPEFNVSCLYSLLRLHPAVCMS
jgi:hypothetical protein